MGEGAIITVVAITFQPVLTKLSLSLLREEFLLVFAPDLLMTVRRLLGSELTCLRIKFSFLATE